METSITMREKMNEFIVKIAQKHSERTAIIYRQALDLFSNHLRESYNLNVEIEASTKLAIDHLKSFLKYLQENRSIETEHLYSRAALAFFQSTHSLNELDSDFTVLASYLESNRRSKEYVVPEIPIATIEKMLAFARSYPVPIGEDVTEREKLIVLRDKAFLLLLSETGLRVSEMCDLNRKNFDSENGQLSLEGDIKYPLSAITTSSLKSYLTARGVIDGSQRLMNLTDLPLFARHDKKAGKRILHLSRWTGANIIDFWLEKTLLPSEVSKLEESGQTISPHTFRHYFVVKMLTDSDDIKNTQRLARHSDRTTTRRYLTSVAKTKPDASS